MNHDELREARLALCLTPQEMAQMTEVDVSSVYKWERDPQHKTAREAPVRVARLIAAYLDGHRPEDWPEAATRRARTKAEAQASVEGART